MTFSMVIYEWHNRVSFQTHGITLVDLGKRRCGRTRKATSTLAWIDTWYNLAKASSAGW